ncbi:MAG: hypothetical protein A2W22_03155 [Candidatus Levybacteria bacterium RBG_16_35_11]|nr:MAG: hypothetical protein A2W22_03155 [Candidatus Levybacteria bacterium RBG_16_35_11]
MTYIRRTKDEYKIMARYVPEYGWEEVHSEDTFREARLRLKEYCENEPQYSHKIVRKRIRIEA